MKKLTEKQKIAKKYVLKDFDFNKCSKVMYLYDWKWAEYQRVPTPKELEEAASQMINDLFLKNCKSVASGGLVAKIVNEEGSLLLVLEFVLEQGQGGRYL